MRKKRIISFVVTTILVFVAVITITIKTQAQNSPGAYIVPTLSTINPGDYFCIDIYVNSDDTSVSTAGFNLTYPTSFTLTAFTYQNLLGTNVLDMDIHSQGDTSKFLNYAVSRLPGNPAAPINGKLATICFIASSPPGTYTLRLNEVSLVDGLGNYLTDIMATDGTVTIKENTSYSSVIIEGVPAYEYHHGCSPTAAGMVIGYWDTLGFDFLVDGNASSQTSEVNNMIASTEHYNDYCLPLDDEDVDPNPKPDKSELPLGDEHSDNCLADFMNTSQSYHGVYNNQTIGSHIPGGIINYVKWKASLYKVYAEDYRWEELSWHKFCTEIDENRPVLLNVETTGKKNPSWHSVTAIGYDNNLSYACYNTWDKSIHWHKFSKVEAGKPWGIYRAVFVNIEQPDVLLYTSFTNWGPAQDVELYIDGILNKTQYAPAYKKVDFSYLIIKGGNHEFQVIGKDFGNNVTNFNCYNLSEVLDIGILSLPIYSVFVDDDFDSSTSGWNIDHFNSLQDGIDAVAEGGTVYVKEGLYYGPIRINQSINLIGEDRNNTIIDGGEIDNGIYVLSDLVNISGFTIQNSGSGRDGMGIYLSSCNNNIIVGNIIKDNEDGIYLASSSNNTINDNTLINNTNTGICFSYSSNNIMNDNIIIDNTYNGIYFWNSSNNTLNGNTISNNSGDGIRLDVYSNYNTITNNTFIQSGYSFYWNSFQNTVTNNTVNGKPLVYLKDKSNIVLDDEGEAGQILLVNCTNITIKNQDLNNTIDGITLLYTNTSVIMDNTIAHNNFFGIVFKESNNNIISGNTITNNTHDNIAIDLLSDNNIITENTITHSYKGINLFCTTNNTITGNIISHCINIGINLYSSSYNTITGNTIACNNIGMFLNHIDNFGNKIFHNNFINNTKHATTITGEENAWDDEYPIGGNYWDNYNGTDNFQGPNQDISGSDGIGDTPYDIPGGSDHDKYPLMVLYKINQAPIADYFYTPLDPTTDDSIRFIDLSTDADGDIVNWTWAFDDGTQGYLQNLTHHYNDEGTYNVTLQVRDNDGAINITSNVINVTLPPQYELYVNIQPPIGGNITLNPSGGVYDAGTLVTVNATANTNYEFDYWNGDASGAYPLIKITIDANKIITAHFKTNISPIAKFNYTIDNLKAIFTDDSTDADGHITNWYWDFGDNNYSDLKDPVNAYEEGGSYIVKLIITDNDRNTDTYSKVITIEAEDDGGGIPGFEMVLLIIALISMSMILRKKS